MKEAALKLNEIESEQLRNYSHEQIIRVVNKTLRQSNAKNTLRALDLIVQSAGLRRRPLLFFGTSKPHEKIPPEPFDYDALFKLFEHKDASVALAAFNAADSFRRTGNISEHDFIDVAFTSLETRQGSNEIAARLTAIANCGGDALSSKLNAILKLTTHADQSVANAAVACLAQIHGGLQVAAVEVAATISELPEGTVRENLFAVLVSGLLHRKWNFRKIAPMLCRGLETTTVIQLLRRMGEAGRGLREFLEMRDHSFEELIPPFVLRTNPNRAIFRDGPPVEVDQKTYDILKLLHASFPKEVPVTKEGFHSDDLTRIRKKYPRIWQYIDPKTGGGTALRALPVSS